MQLDAPAVIDVRFPTSHAEDGPDATDPDPDHSDVGVEGARPIDVATGEHAPDTSTFMQFMPAGATQLYRLDACRLGGVNAVLAVPLRARKFDVPVCRHAGGVGSCESVQQLAIFDCSAVPAERHEHFTEPVRMVGARYAVVELVGYSAKVHRGPLESLRSLIGDAWRGEPRWGPAALDPAGGR